MIVYVTKHALTQGILQKNIRTTHSAKYVVDLDNAIDGFHKPYWHETREEAIEHAESMRVKKIASLKKQLTKIESLTF